jgi:hypothetical protein
MHPTLASLADDVRIRGSPRCLQPERPVRAMPVVVLDVDSKDPIQVAAPDDQQPIQALGADRPHPALRDRVRVGRLDRCPQHGGALRAEHVVEGAANLASRSRSKKRTGRLRSSNASKRLRACWVTQVPSGLAVTPARWTRRVSSSMKNNTYSRLSQTVSTVKKSQARIAAACWRRNACHVLAVRRGAGSSP